MTLYLAQFLADPLYYLGYLLAFGGTFGLLLFLRGFFSGIGHVIRQDANAEHMDHYRTRAVWGVLLMAWVLGWWETLRWLLSAFGYTTVNGTAIFVAVLGIIFALWKTFLAKPAAGGGH